MRRLGLALAEVPTGQRRVPWQQVPPLAGARLAWALARQSPGQGRVLRAHQYLGAPGLALPRVSSPPQPVRSWIGHG